MIKQNDYEIVLQEKTEIYGRPRLIMQSKLKVKTMT